MRASKPKTRFWRISAILAASLITGISLSAQDQAPSSAQPPPSDQSTTSAPPQNPAQPQPEPQAQTPPPTASPVQASTPAKKPGTSTQTHKVVVRNGGAKDESAQLAPGLSKDQQLRSRESTSKLLAATDANVKLVGDRQLTPAQQNLLDQIHTYMRQSREASDSGDLGRAHTLAYKARLLSDELRK